MEDIMIEKCEEIKETLPLSDVQQEELSQIQDHLTRGELYIAFLGKFSAGKSYLINELIGRKNLLPTKVMETTAIVTEVRKGSEEFVVADHVNGKSESVDITDIQSYIHGNNGIEGISKLRVTILDSQLPEEIVLVDTPGRNTFHERHINMSEQAILDAEAAVYVLSTAGVSKEDLLYLKHIHQIQPNLYFVLNKIDRLFQEDEGEDLSEVVFRVEEELNQALGEQVTVYPVSAKEGTGIEFFRMDLFDSLRTDFNEMKKQAADQRLQLFIHKISEDLATTLHFINTSIDQGVAGLEAERANIIADKDRVERLIEGDRFETLEKWREIRRAKRNELESLKLRLKQVLIKELPTVDSKPAAENIALTIQEELLTARKEFIDETMVEMKRQSKHDLDLQFAEIDQQITDFKIPKPSLDVLEQAQQEQLITLVQEVEELKRKFKEVAEVAAVDGNDQKVDEEKLHLLKAELMAIKSKLDLPYEAQYVERERSDANYYQDMLKSAGKVADIAMMLIPMAGQAKVATQAAVQAGKIAAKEGAKGVVKESIKAATREVAKTVVKEAGEKVVKKSAEQLLKEKALNALKLMSFEGIGEKLGTGWDEKEGRTYLVEDDQHRKQFFQQRQEIQMAYMEKERELKRLFQQQEKGLEMAQHQAEQKRKLEALKTEKERELVLLQQHQEKERKQASNQAYQAMAEEEIGTYIAAQVEILENWLIAESYQLEQAVRSGLQIYYQEQFDKLEQQLAQVEQSYEESNHQLIEQRNNVEQQLTFCDRYLGVLVP
jgi:GTPase Era involved in 16S rRNA processing